MTEAFDTDRERLLAMEPWDFDQSSDGWRKFEREPLRAVAIIQAYLAENGERIAHQTNEKRVSIELMHFHTGQLYAYAGSEHRTQAVEAFGRAFQDGKECWNSYVSATLGFLQNDERRIDDAIRTIESSKSEDAMSGNLGIVRNFKKALGDGVHDYAAVYEMPR